MKHTKSVMLSIVVVMAASAVVASAASAAEFQAEKYPVVVSASGSNHGFKIAGATTVCKKATFLSGEILGPSTTLSVLPSYTECETELAGIHGTTVNMKGCEFTFHAPTANSVDIKCGSGGPIEVEVAGLEGCVIKVESQPGLKTVEYVNGGTGNKRKVQVRAEVSGIAWEATAGCKLAQSKGTEGEYRLGKITETSVALEPTGHPATATAAGYEPGHVGEEAHEIGIFVE